MRFLPLILVAPIYAGQVYSLAWKPDGDVIALGGYKEVRLVDTKGKVTSTLGGHAEAVRALAFSGDGKLLAAAGGLPGRKGEVKIWNGAQVTATLSGHSDCIYAVAFAPDNRTLATASYDKLIKLWDVQSGKEVRTLRDHIDAIYALEFTPDGKRLISGSADRSVKVWDPATGARLYTLSESGDAVNTIAVDPRGERVAAGGLDKTIHIWKLGENGATLESTLIAHEDAILKLAWSPDGKALVSSSADRTIKFFRADDLTETRPPARQPDWVYGLQFAPAGRRFAAARLNGSIEFYEVENAKNLAGK
jgi:WD40 repeat protein